MSEWILAAVKYGNSDLVVIDDFDGLDLSGNRLTNAN